MSYLTLWTFLMALLRVFATKFAKFDVTDGCNLTYGYIIDTRDSVRSVTECARHCSRNDQCISMKYDKPNKTCQLNSGTYNSFSHTCSTMLTFATLQKDTVSKLINVYCTNSSDCPVTNSQCHHNNCQCDPGYSYKQHDEESCVTSCDVYGSTFTTYYLHRLRLHNTKTLFNIDSDEVCKSKCLSWTAFICKSVEYNLSKNKCHLSTATAATAPTYFEERDSFIYHNRNCQ